MESKESEKTSHQTMLPGQIYPIEQSPKIHLRISMVMNDIEAISKGRTSGAGGGASFKFRGIDDVYNSLHSILAKHKVFTTTEVLEHVREQRTTKSGTLMTYSIMKIRFRFFTEDGSFVESVTIGEGSDAGDKASNKSMAIAHKYALIQIFAIPTEEEKDPETANHEFRARAPATKAAPPSAAAKSNGTADHGAAAEKMITTDQARRLFAIAKSRDWTEDMVRELLVNSGVVSGSTKNIPLAKYDGIIAIIEGKK